MAHFLTLVLLPADTDDPAAVAEQRMLPYFDDGRWDGDDWDNRPHFECDGYVIGGRFDGIIWGKEQHYNLSPEQFRRRYGLDVVKAVDNIRPVSEVVPECKPYAFVLPDGSWIDRQGLTGAAVDEWVRRVLQAHSSCLVVAIDCHC